MLPSKYVYINCDILIQNHFSIFLSFLLTCLILWTNFQALNFSAHLIESEITSNRKLQIAEIVIASILFFFLSIIL